MVKIVPLRGTAQFSALMRTKPLARWENALIHVRVLHVSETQTDALQISAQQTRKTPLSVTNPCIYLGQVVPKKVFPLAVDRNRVRRILRAYCLAIVTSNKGFSGAYQVLFRLKPLDKSQQKNKQISPKTKSPEPTKASAAHLLPTSNPQSQVFSAQIFALLEQALRKAQDERSTRPSQNTVLKTGTA